MSYELLAGQHPFAGKRNMYALVAAHLTEQPKPLTTHSTDVTASLSTIVMQCLGKDPAERPESASLMTKRRLSLLEANIAAMTGPTAIVTTVARELAPLLVSPRLGPLVRRLTLWATRPAASTSSSTPAVA